MTPKPRHAAAFALVGLAPVGTLFFASLIVFLRARDASTLLQLLGAGGLVVVVLAHVFEGLDLFLWMGWGLEHSPGHYFDLCAAVLGLTLFPAGFLLAALKQKRR